MNIKEDLFEIGTIVNTHGIRGDVKITPWTDSDKVFESFSHFYTIKKDVKTKYEIEHIRYHKFSVLAKLKGVDTMNDAELLKGQTIYIERSALPELEENTYYIKDLIGLSVKTADGNVIGTLNDVFSTGNNDVYVVKPTEPGHDILIPAIKEVVTDIDIKAGFVTINLIEGLME